MCEDWQSLPQVGKGISPFTDHIPIRMIMGFTPQGEVNREVNKHLLSTYRVTVTMMNVYKYVVVFNLCLCC